MKKQEQDSKTAHIKKEVPSLLEILKRLDGEEFILNLPVDEEVKSRERTGSI